MGQLELPEVTWPEEDSDPKFKVFMIIESSYTTRAGARALWCGHKQLGRRRPRGRLSE